MCGADERYACIAIPAAVAPCAQVLLTHLVLIALSLIMGLQLFSLSLTGDELELVSLGALSFSRSSADAFSKSIVIGEEYARDGILNKPAWAGIASVSQEMCNRQIQDPGECMPYLTSQILQRCISINQAQEMQGSEAEPHSAAAHDLDSVRSSYS